MILWNTLTVPYFRLIKAIRKHQLSIPDAPIYAPIAELATHIANPIIDNINPAVPNPLFSLFNPMNPIISPTIDTGYPINGIIHAIY